MTRLVVVLSSPSGAGKTTLARALLERREDLGYSISATTRPPRPGERDGVDYYFLSEAEFQQRRDAGDFVETAEYSGYLYGTLESELDRMLAAGRHVLLDIEVQGARQLRQRRDDVVTIFILPPSMEALWSRLSGRASDAQEDLRRRLDQADWELQQAEWYDYVVINDDREEAVRHVAAIIDAEAHRTSRQRDLTAFIEELRRALARRTRDPAED